MSEWGGGMKPQEAGEGIEEWEVLDLLVSLVDKNLVAYDEEADRFSLLETVHDYGRVLLNDYQESERWRTCHLQQFLALAEEAEPHLNGPEQAAWFERLETEHDNLRAALEWCRGERDGAEKGLQLAGVLW